MRRILLILLLFSLVLVPSFTEKIADYNFNYYIEFEKPEHLDVYFAESVNEETGAYNPVTGPIVLEMDESGVTGTLYYIVVEYNSNKPGKTINLSVTPDAFRVYTDGNFTTSNPEFGCIFHKVNIRPPVGGDDVSIVVTDTAVKEEIKFEPVTDTTEYVYSVSYAINMDSYNKAPANQTYVSNVTVECEVVE